MPAGSVKRQSDDNDDHGDSGQESPSPEEMMQRLLDRQPGSQRLGPPEDVQSAAIKSQAQPMSRPEDLAPIVEAPADAQPRLDPLVQEAAQRLIKMRNQAATLADLLDKREISFDDYERLLLESMVQDESGVWWMIDADNDQWYRHDPSQKEWLEDFPHALQEWESANEAAPTETVADPAATGDAIVDHMGVEIGRRPPTRDDLYTVPGTAAYADELPHQQLTANADPQAARTLPSVRQHQQATVPAGVDGELDLQPSPVVRELLATQRKRNIRAALTLASLLVMIALIGGIIAAAGIMFWYRDTVNPYREAIASLAAYTPEFQTARIFDAQGGLIAALNSQATGARTHVPLERISPYMIHAIVSQENERYFDDPGFDAIAIARAFLQNLSGGSVESGASTITQQIARNLVLRDREVSVQRKLNEILVALEIANAYDKNFILELYLNEVFFGNQNYGVEAASQFYFNQAAAELNYAQAALLATIVPSPLQYDPVSNRENAIRGMRLTMGKMLDVGCLQFQHADWPTRGPFCIVDGREIDIDGSQQVLVRQDPSGRIVGGAAIVQIAEIETRSFQPLAQRSRHPHFAQFVRDIVEEELGAESLFQRGLNIYTTLDPDLQAVAEKALGDQVRSLVSNATGVNTGAVMVTDPGSGAIRAMVGSHDFDDEIAGQVNNALTWQQPGSLIKPIVYAAALTERDGSYLTPASIVWDVPVSYDMGAAGSYEPANFDGRFHGPVSLRRSLQNSYNVASVKVYEQVGNARFSELAHRLGLRFPAESPLTLASALGANEVTLYDMMGAYGVFANGGALTPLHAIARITETIGGEEKDIAREGSPAQQVISPAIAYLMQNILSDDSERSPSIRPGSQLTLAHLGIPTQNLVAAKTGTSNGARDLWTMGFTSEVVVGVWLGTTDNSPTWNTGGLQSAAPVWNAVMSAAALQKAPVTFENPGRVVAREICRTTGTLNYPGCPDPVSGLFIHDQYPPPPEHGFIQTIAVDSWSGLRANEFCSANVIDKTFIAIDDSAALAWLNDTAEGQAFVRGLNLASPVQLLPQASCAQGQSLPLVQISAPNDAAVVRDYVEIRGQVQGPDFDRYELEIRPGDRSRDFPAHKRLPGGDAALWQRPGQLGYRGRASPEWRGHFAAAFALTQRRGR